jgi:hypothetical protein
MIVEDAVQDYAKQLISRAQSSESRSYAHTLAGNTHFLSCPDESLAEKSHVDPVKVAQARAATTKQRREVCPGSHPASSAIAGFWDVLFDRHSCWTGTQSLGNETSFRPLIYVLGGRRIS